MATYDTSETAGAGVQAGAQLGRLNDLDDFKVADGFPDPRGWDVKTADGQRVGKVGDLIVDTQVMRVRYVDVELDRSVSELARDAVTPGDQEQHTLLPIGAVQLDDARDDVLVGGGYTLEQIAGLPRYGGASISRDYERSLVDRHRGRGAAGAVAGAAAGAAATARDAVTPDSYEHDDYDDQRPFAGRRARAAGQGDQRLTLAEEQLSVGKRQTAAGEVELRKTVETERVHEQVQLRHDEVSVERHPVTDASGITGEARIGDEGEIRIPVMEEQLVVEKKLVPREEIIVRKRQVTEQETVSADLRRERLDVNDAGARTAGFAGGGTSAGTSGARDRATDSGLLDRAADKLDNLKDRVDGNPASRPGPDATDRRI